VRITYIGHAGLFIESDYGSILCDPWFNPAYLYSWFPFPANDHLNKDKFISPDFLYVSHLHLDHFDVEFLRTLNKDVTVLVPEFKSKNYLNAFRELGFKNFEITENSRPLKLSADLEIFISALTSPTDGPLGDSLIGISDGKNKVLNQNDSRPTKFDQINSFGPYDLQFLQFSGAIWYPMVYRIPELAKERLSRQKRSNQLNRALQYIKEIHAKQVIPFAGPPCFLDEELFYLNDIETSESSSNIFPDSKVFVEFLESNGYTNSRVVYPGTQIILEGNSIEYLDPDLNQNDLNWAYSNKNLYLRNYQRRYLDRINSEKRSWDELGKTFDLLESSRKLFEPLLEKAFFTKAGINGRILISSDNQSVVIDFLESKVEKFENQVCRYQFYISNSVLAATFNLHSGDWVNLLFLSCRFEAQRDGPYNEYVYSFFKSLSTDNMEYVEKYYSTESKISEEIICGDYIIQRYCPHLQADLSKFGEIKDGVITCMLHGWQFEVATGKCLTSNDRKLRTRKLDKQMDHQQSDS
jgi:UDP-MurNAc hydroxylase